MEKLGLNDIRKKYLDFFESKGHLVLPSFSLVPKDDPSILLNNAGMTPLKKWFTGEEEPPRRRVATCQKCIRTPDIDNVGYTARHGTFFEMLGNFSFNDYFKREAIHWAWEFVHDVLKIPYERLYVSVFHEDDEAYDIWHDEIKLPPEKIFRLGKEDNFWEHGVGPCGPCSEIFVDRGEKYGCGSPDCQVGCECDRFVEIWNLVFTQFKRLEDGSYEELSFKNIDTGGGLERFAMVMQDVGSLFEVDTVRAILDAVGDLAKVHYHDDEAIDVSLRVITDHIRSAIFMLADGVRPSNEGRGYVLRRLIRRAAARGLMLDIEDAFLCSIAEVAIAQSREAYPELAERHEQIMRELESEEVLFRTAVEKALPTLKRLIASAREQGEAIPGAELFKLHDTFGLPIALSQEMAEDSGVAIDRAGFDLAMAEQKRRARQDRLDNAGSAWTSLALPESIKELAKTEFLGYLSGQSETASLLAILEVEDDELRQRAEGEAGGEYFLIFDRSPFYAESGGQVGDSGEIRDGEGSVADILDCRKQNGYFMHHAIAIQPLHTGRHYSLVIDEKRRQDIRRNHTATHMMHAALRQVIGPEVEQRGSLVHPDYLRFDFTCPRPLTADEIDQVEDIVNREILKNTAVETEIMDLEAAKAKGAMALFGEKYDARVRVLSIGDFSLELCGGTHLGNTAEAGIFHIVSESGIAAGIRRIVAVTGEAAFAYAREQRAKNRELSTLLGVREDDFVRKVRDLLADNAEMEQDLKKMKQAQNKDLASRLRDQVETIAGFQVLLTAVENLEVKELRALSDRLMQEQRLDFLLLLSALDDKVLLLAKASDRAIAAGHRAGELVREAATAVGGSGGGKPEMAQAGGRNPEAIPAAIEAVRKHFIA